jgi:methionyl aminopeptidase
MIIRKSPAEIDQMAKSGEVVAETIALIGEHIKPGVTTQELDALAEEFILSRGGVPTFKGYRGYPASICASPNSMVVHGIPGPYKLADGDVLDTCQASLAAGIEQARPGNRLSDISHAIQTVTEAGGCAIVRSLVGHGVGRAMHEDPQIPNYGEPGRGPELQVGMTLAIEPMINLGGAGIFTHDDQWSISTNDGSLSAHFEHTVAITEQGPRILTQAQRSVGAGLLR